MYEMICLLICVFAVFGGYVALRVAAHALLRRLIRTGVDESAACAGCTDCAGCSRGCCVVDSDGDGSCAACPKNSSDCKTDTGKD